MSVRTVLFSACNLTTCNWLHHTTDYIKGVSILIKQQQLLPLFRHIWSFIFTLLCLPWVRSHVLLLSHHDNIMMKSSLKRSLSQKLLKKTTLLTQNIYPLVNADESSLRCIVSSHGWIDTQHDVTGVLPVRLLSVAFFMLQVHLAVRALPHLRLHVVQTLSPRPGGRDVSFPGKKTKNIKTLKTWGIF